MKVLAVLCVLACCLAVADSNLDQFRRMIRCVTGRSFLDFWGYGCWCGWGGSGAPLDAIDRCCQTHDRCYDAAIRRGCTWNKHPKAVHYVWDYDHCPRSECTDRPGTCDRQACECDLAASRCYQQNINTYDRSLKGVDKKTRC